MNERHDHSSKVFMSDAHLGLHGGTTFGILRHRIHERIQEIIHCRECGEWLNKDTIQTIVLQRRLKGSRRKSQR